MTTTDPQILDALRAVFELQQESERLRGDTARRSAYEALLAEHQAATEGLGDEEQTGRELAAYEGNVPAPVTPERLVAYAEHRIAVLRPLAERDDLGVAASSVEAMLADAERELAELTAVEVEIVSFGFGHQADEQPPAAHIVLDLRHHFRDPHVHADLREMTGHDLPVSRLVMDTPGIHELLVATAAQVHAFRMGPTAGPVRVAVGCVGGRHRSVATALALPSYLRDADTDLTMRVTHLHDTRPVIQRDRVEH